MSVSLLKIMHARLESVMDEIRSQEGVITEEQESAIAEILATERDAIAEAAKAVKEDEESAERLRETRKRWNEAAAQSIERTEERAGKVRSLIRQAMEHFVLDTGKKTLKSHDRAVSVTYSGVTEKTKGRLEIEEVAFGAPERISDAYDLDTVMTNGAPLDCFTEIRLFKLDKDKLRQALDAGKKIEGARIVREGHVTIKIG